MGWRVNMRMDFLYQADENYAVYGGVSVTSLFENNKDADEIYVHFLTSGFDDSIKEKLKILEEKYHRHIILYDAEELKQRIIGIGATIHDGSYATYYKLFLQEFLPEEVERILYIDDDTVILGNLQELFTMDMQDRPLAIVKDSDPLPFYDQTPEEAARCRYNCGVMLIDMKKWREKSYQTEIEDYMRTHHNYCHDQDIVNRMYYEEIRVLPCEYNVQPILYAFTPKQYFSVYHQSDYYSQDEIEVARNNIKIAHFFHWCGESAWNKGTLHPYRKLFHYYLELSPWAEDYKAAKKEIGTVQKIEKILYVVLPKRVFLWIWHTYRAHHGLALIQK